MEAVGYLGVPWEAGRLGYCCTVGCIHFISLHEVSVSMTIAIL